MKELLKIVIGLVGTVALAITGLFYLATWMMVGVADEFFAALKKQDIATARSFLTEDFNAGTDAAALTEFLAELVTFKQAAWSNRHIASSRGRLDGEVITGNGSVPLMMMFVKEHGAWKIYAIQKLAAGSAATSVSLPSRREQVALVKRAMVDFGISIRDNDMKHFHSVVAPRWQRETSPEKLSEVFADVMGKRVDFAVLEEYEPIIDPPAVPNEDGEMILEGHFPTEPTALHFKQTYIYEGLGWKLVGFGFRSGPSEDKPAKEKTHTLVQASHRQAYQSAAVSASSSFGSRSPGSMLYFEFWSLRTNTQPIPPGAARALFCILKLLGVDGVLWIAERQF